MQRICSSLAVLLSMLALAGVVAACGSEDSGRATSAATSASEQRSATSAPQPPTTPPTAAERMGVKIPLERAPEPGKTIAWLECELPQCALFTPGVQKAAAALGWNVKVVPYRAANPDAGMLQAVNEGVDFIAVSGAGRALYENALRAAKARGIPVMAMSAADPPAPEDGLYTDFGDTAYYDTLMVNLANWSINATDGAADTVFVNLPDYPILAEGVKQAKAAWARGCPDCGFEELNITADEIGAGEVPGKVIAYLQSNPDVNVVEMSFNDIVTGMPEALKGAGLADRVKIVTVGVNKPVLAAIRAGEVAAATAQPDQYMGWLLVDAMARVSEDMPLEEERAAADLPTWVVDSAEEAEKLEATDGTWAGPEGYEEEFKKLWKVG